MTNNYKLKAGLQAREKKLKPEEEYANYDIKKHIMLIGEEKYRNLVEKASNAVQDEFLDMEKVELIDYWNGENGRTNKKR